MSDPHAWATEKARQLLAENPSLDRGLDLLLADGMPDDKAAQLMLACVAEGRDPEQFARHVIKLRRAIRRPSGSTP